MSILLSTLSNWQIAVYWLKIRYLSLVTREPLTGDLHEFYFGIQIILVFYLHSVLALA